MIAAEGVSLLSFMYPVLSLPLIILAGAATFFITLKNAEWGIYLLFGELFFGSRGHLLEYDIGFMSVSLRLVIFAVVFLACLSKFSIFNFQFSKKSKILYTLLLIVIGFGIIKGYFSGNAIANVFNDANGYLYLLILPAVFSVIKTRRQIENILLILAAAILVVAGKTLLIFVWFSFGLPGVANVYHWIVAQDFGEITGDVGKASRVFMQSQFWSLMGLFIFSIPLVTSLRGVIAPKQSPEQEFASLPLAKTMNWLIVAASILAIIMSLSRSFWLGAIAGGLFAIITVLWQFRAFFRSFLGLGLKLGLIAVLEIGLLYGIVAAGGNAIAESVSSRGGDPTKEAASGARLLLLPELLAGIKQSPIFGAGFGEMVTYKSYLPDRVSRANPDGEITNFAFEWGYLDIALKIGGLGLIIYLLFIAHIFAMGWKAMNFQFPISNFQILGLLSALAALLVLNVTTPYLNHPLGIGYIILSGIIFKIYGNEQQ